MIKTFIEWFNEYHETSYREQEEIHQHFERYTEGNAEEATSFFDNACDTYSDYLRTAES